MLQLTFLSPARLEQLGQQSFFPPNTANHPDMVSHFTLLNSQQPSVPKIQRHATRLHALRGKATTENTCWPSWHFILWKQISSCEALDWEWKKWHLARLVSGTIGSILLCPWWFGWKKTMQTTRHYTCKKAGCNKSIELPRTWYKHHP